jgi:hypothetical protein
MRALKRYQTLFLLLLGGTVAAALALNTTVNPWRVTPVPWSAESLEPYRDIDAAWTRTAKAGLAASGRWDAALFGSSRVDIALDPRHRAFDGMRCVNLGLNAGLIDQTYPLFRYFMDRQSPQLVVVAIDASDLTTPVPRKNTTDFAMSPLDPKADPVERALRYHAGISTLHASADVLVRAATGTPAEHTPQGFRQDAAYPQDVRALISTLYLSTTVQMARNHMRNGGLSDAKMAMLEDMVARCREKNARLLFFLTPNHALFQHVFRELGDRDALFADDRRALAELAARANRESPDAPPVEVWDFLDADPRNAPPLPPADAKGARMPGWIDLFHAAPGLGNEMLDRLDGSGTYGVRLLPDEVDARVAAVGRQLDDHAARHPGDLAFLRKHLSRYQAPPPK